MSMEGYLAVYLDAGVPIHKEYEDVDSKCYCAICLKQLKYCCKCPDPDFCETCFDHYQDKIILCSGHFNTKKGFPIFE
jgi:hypothetical protein